MEAAAWTRNGSELARSFRLVTNLPRHYSTESMCEHKEERGYVSKYLTHFVGRRLKDEYAFQLLCKVIRDRKLLPGGSEEKWAGNVRIQLNKALSDNELFTPEMVCFCDIPLNKDKLKIHADKYSKFGLAFDKTWLAQKRGASPVFYLAKGSCCTDHRFPNRHPCRGTIRKAFFDLAAHDWMKQLLARGLSSEDRPRSDNMFLWYVLSYCKFFDETLPEKNADNYYMEREWRTIGQVTFEPENIAKILLPRKFEQEFLDAFSDARCHGDLKKKVFVLDDSTGSQSRSGTPG